MKLCREHCRNRSSQNHFRKNEIANRTNRSSAGIAQLPADSYSYDTNDELTADNGGDYTYDDNGNITYTPDAVPYTYDALNHLTQAGYPTAFTNMAYDGDGNRATKTAYNTSVGSIVTFYLVDDRNPSGYPQVVEEHQYTPAVSQGFLSRVYNYGLGLISQQQFDTNTFLPSTLSYYGLDGHGSVRFLMDTNGSVTDTYTYDAYGSLIAQTFTGSQPTPNNYLYAGQQWDSDLGLYYNRARYLNTDTGRFWTMDTYEGDNEDPLSLHKYLYGADNPVDNADPSGNQIDDLAISMDIDAGLDALSDVVVEGAEATEEETLAASEAIETEETGVELGETEGEVEEDIARTTLKQEGKTVRGLIDDVKRAKNLAKNIKVIPMPKSVIPAVCANIQSAFVQLRSPVLKRVNDTQRKINRKNALAGLGFAGVGMSWDEYPFASGASIPPDPRRAITKAVPWWQNSVQGGIIAGCYKIEKINVDTPYIVIIVP